MKLPLIFGHRGTMGIVPENTLSGFKKAIELGIDGVELDVHLSKDGKMVVVHDMDLNRLAGLNISIKDSTYEELKKIDISNTFIKSQEIAYRRLPEEKVYFLELKIVKENEFYLNIFEQITKNRASFYLHWDGQEFDIVKKLFFPKNNGKTVAFRRLKINKKNILDLQKGKLRVYHNEHIPLLKEVLKLLKDKLFVNMEIKGGENIYLGIVDKVVKESKEFGYNNILFSCFNRDTLISLKKKYPYLKVNGLYNNLIIAKISVN